MLSAYHNHVSKKSEGEARKRHVKPGSTKTSSPAEDKKGRPQGGAPRERLWPRFLCGEAPDYSEQGIQTFMDFINSREFLDGLVMYGAFLNCVVKSLCQAFYQKKSGRRDLTGGISRHCGGFSPVAIRKGNAGLLRCGSQ